jgi:hypothetical protein
LGCIAEYGTSKVRGESTLALAAVEARDMPARIIVFDAFVFDGGSTVLADIG